MYKLPSWHSHVKSLFNLKFAFENRPVSDAPRLAILYSGIIPGIVSWQGNRNRLWAGNNTQRALSWPLLHLTPDIYRSRSALHGSPWDVDSCVSCSWSCVWFWFLLDLFWPVLWLIIGTMSRTVIPMLPWPIRTRILLGCGGSVILKTYPKVGGFCLKLLCHVYIVFMLSAKYTVTIDNHRFLISVRVKGFHMFWYRSVLSTLGQVCQHIQLLLWKKVWIVCFFNNLSNDV